MSRVYQIWCLLLVLKIVVAAIIPVGGDEAYYWVWSKHLQLSYFDHPPFVAWLNIFAPVIPGIEGLVRLPGLLLGHFALLFWIDLLKSKTTENQLILFLLLIFACPMTGLGSIIITPDIPLIFFWSAAIWAIPRVIDRGYLFDYLFLGSALGLAFLSKYSAVLFLPPLFLWLTFDKKWTSVRPFGVVLTIISGLLFCSPVLIWNIQNDFISFNFQLNHGLGDEVWDPSNTMTYLLAILFIGFPTVYWGALKKTTTDLKFLKWFAFFPLAFFFYTSFSGKVEANWPLTAFPALFALCAANSSTIRSQLAAPVFWNSLLALFVSHLVVPWIPGIPAQPPQIQELWQDRVFLNELKDKQPFFGYTYQSASYLYLYSQTPVYKLHKIGRTDFFDFLEQSIPKENKFYLALKDGVDLSSYWTDQGYRIIEKKNIAPKLWLATVSK